MLCTVVFCASIAASAQPRLPDLTVASTRVRVGRVTAVIGNRGAAAPVIRATTTLFIREEGKRPRSIDAVTPMLLPGTTAEITFDVVVPACATIQVMVDSDGRVAESNEGNNRTNNETIGTVVVPRPRGVTIDPALSRHTRTVIIPPLRDGQPRPTAAASFPSPGARARRLPERNVRHWNRRPLQTA